MGYTRKEFLALSAALTGALGLTRSRGRDAETSSRRDVLQTSRPFEPDLILTNGNVLTQDDALQRAEAFAVKDGKFLAVGSNAEVRNLASSRTRVIDAARMTVVRALVKLTEAMDQRS